jgi:hypothetical protein
MFKICAVSRSLDMELKIAICDDEQEQAQYIKMLVNKWAGGKAAKTNICTK